MSSYFTLQNGRSVLLYPDENGNAKGLLYYDDYSSYDYQKENYTLIEYTLSNFSNFSSKILNQPKTKNNEKIDEPSDFIENIYLYGHPTPEKVKIVDHIVDTFTMPISYNLNHVKEKNLLHLSKMKIKTSSDFEIKFS